MGKGRKCPGQLRLELDWGLLSRLADRGETMSAFEEASLRFISGLDGSLAQSAAGRERSYPARKLA
jgi:hypothetical protein